MNIKKQIRAMLEEIDKSNNLYVFNAKKSIYIKIDCEDVVEKVKEMLKQKEENERISK